MTAATQPAPSRRASRVYRVLYTPVYDLLCGRVAPRLDIKTVIAEADLPAALASTIQQTVRRTRLWKIEKADVARELIAHFQDGTGAGAAAEELQAVFGDPCQVARLIRWAKKRNRPLWWRVFERTSEILGVIFVLLLVVYAVLAIRLYSQSANISRNYVAEWNAAALAVPEAERAWPVYRWAYLETDTWPTPSHEDHRPGGERWPELADFARRHGHVAETYRRAAAMPRLGALLGPLAHGDEPLYEADRTRTPAETRDADPPDENPLLLTVVLPHPTVFRDAARLLQIDAYLAAEAGDSDRALADVRAQLGIAEHALQLNFLIGDLISLRMIRLASSLTGRLLHKYPDLFSDDQLVELSHRLAAVAGGGALRVRFASEQATFEDFVQRYYTDDGHGDGLPRPELLRDLAGISSDNSMTWIPAHAGATVIMPAATAVLSGRRELLEKSRQITALYEAEGRTPLWQRQPSEADRQVERLSASKYERLRYLPLAVLQFSLTRASLMSEYVTQRRDATLVALALELYRRRHGAWPRTLEELTPQLLPQVPPDRYDGEALKYRIVAGEPVLYSIGVDRDDDGGRMPITGVIPLGHPDHPNRAARDWLPPSTVALDLSPDGDWLLWPPVE